MKIFDKNNPIHRQILREEIESLLEQQQDFAGPEAGEQLAKDDQAGRTNLRAIKSKIDMDSADAFNPNPYNRLAIKYLDIVNKDTLNDITVEQSYDLLEKLQELGSKLSDKPRSNKTSTEFNPYDMPGGRANKGYTGD